MPDIALAAKVRFEGPHRSIAEDGWRSALVKEFRCGPLCKISTRTDCGPRWKSSQGGSRGRLGSGYGESARAVEAAGATCAPTEGSQALDSGLVLRLTCGFPGGEGCPRPFRQQPEALGAWLRDRDCGNSRWFAKAVNGCCVMRHAPSVVRETWVSDRAERSR